MAWACVRSSCAWSSATCASRISVLVATPAANRSPTTRRASEAERTASLAAAIDACAASRSSRRCSTSTSSWLSNSASRSFAASWVAACCATSAATRPPSQNVQLKFTPASHDAFHSSVRGKKRVLGRARSTPPPTARTGRLPAAAASRRSPAPAMRASMACRSGLAFRASSTSCGTAAAAGGAASSCALRVSGASGGAPMSRRKSAIACSRRLRAWINSTCCRERCASTDRTSFGGTRPTFNRLRTSSSVASMRRSDSVRTLTDSPAVTTAQ